MIPMGRRVTAVIAPPKAEEQAEGLASASPARSTVSDIFGGPKADAFDPRESSVEAAVTTEAAAPMRLETSPARSLAV